MKNYPVIISLLFLIGLFSACDKKPASSGNQVTKRIQYDVSIKNADPEFDWWEQNIEGEKRESLIKNIMNAVSEGKVKVYDFISNAELSKQAVANIIQRRDTVSLESPEPPHDLYDTVIIRNLDLRNITRLRFLEEWSMDEKSLAFTKKVVGLCPLLEVYTETGELKGYKPLFWVFYDSQYPEALKK